jgi:ferredoxin
MDCQRNCPDHAIDFRNNGDSVSIMFDSELCGGCMVCEKSCPDRAMSVSRMREFSPIVGNIEIEKARDEYAKCEGCGIPLGSRHNLAALKKSLTEQGVGAAAVRRIDLCNQCKLQATIRPLAQH